MELATGRRGESTQMPEFTCECGSALAAPCYSFAPQAHSSVNAGKALTPHAPHTSHASHAPHAGEYLEMKYLTESRTTLVYSIPLAEVRTRPCLACNVLQFGLPSVTVCLTMCYSLALQTHKN